MKADPGIDATHDARLTSFVKVPPGAPFPIQNLPYGVFRRRSGGAARIGMAIGDLILDLSVLDAHGLLDDPIWNDERPFARATLNAFMALGRPAWTAARARLQSLLRADVATLRDNAEVRAHAFVPMREATMLLPVHIGDYTDFYASKQHAVNVGTLFRGADHALMPNWVHLPVGYHGRASSVIISETNVVRPHGQRKPDDGPPEFGPSRELDFELELGVFVGPGNERGHPIPITRAADHLFGLVLVNDWSARDIQRWEYVPLGPFLGKNFATSISPWVVTLEALAPARIVSPVQEPEPLPYLRSAEPWGFDIALEVSLQTAAMAEPQHIVRSNARHLYWTFAQQLAHHTSNGCNVRPGDLLASGTISGSDPESYGSLLERTWRGTRPLALPDGEHRTFLEDGDRVAMTAWAQADGYRIGFGEVAGRISGY